MSENRRRHQVVKSVCLVAGTWLVVEWWPLTADGYRLPVAALGLSLVVSGWAVLLQKLIRGRPWCGLFRIRSWEASFYEALGVRKFKWMVNSPWYRALWGPSLRRQGPGHSLTSLADDMRAAESAHALAFLLIVGLTLYAVASGWGIAAVWLSIGNVLMNLYPVMLQRYNRSRIEGLQERHRCTGRRGRGIGKHAQITR